MDYENLLVAYDGPVATVTVNRPKALNALNTHTITEILELSTDLEANPNVRAVILTGAGEKAFVAGADISEMSEMRPREARHFAELGGALMTAIETSDKPWVAAVNGFALGGGCELALACDFIYAARGAKIGQPEVTLGVIPGFGGTQRLLRRVGVGKAREIVYTGDMVDADEGYRIGLVDLVVERADLVARARQTCEKIATKGPLAIAEAKRAILHGQSLPLPDACALEVAAFSSLFDTSDQKEGMKAFLQKRPAVFEGK
jgi:enoyl-CoA hydratase